MAENLGLKTLQAPCAESFQFGDGNVEYAKKKIFYPVFIEGKYRGVLDQAEVNVDCPQLLSKMVMRKWDVDLCFGKSQTRINKFGVNLPFNNKSVPIVNILDVTSEQLKEQWDKIYNQSILIDEQENKFNNLLKSTTDAKKLHKTHINEKEQLWTLIETQERKIANLQ